MNNFLEKIPNDTKITIYQKKSNKNKLKESYDRLSGKKTKSLFFTGHPVYIYIYMEL